MDRWYQWYPIFPEKSQWIDGIYQKQGWWPLVSMRRLTQVSLHGYGALCDLVRTKIGYSIAPKHVPYMMNHWIEGNISNLRINPKNRSYRYIDHINMHQYTHHIQLPVVCTGKPSSFRYFSVAGWMHLHRGWPRVSHPLAKSPVFPDLSCCASFIKLPSGERLHFAMERSTMLLMGKSTNFRLGHFQLLFVCSPETTHFGGSTSWVD